MNGAFSPAKLAFDEWVGTFALHWKAKASSFTLLFAGTMCLFVRIWGIGCRGMCVCVFMCVGGSVTYGPDLLDSFSAIYN